MKRHIKTLLIASLALTAAAPAFADRGYDRDHDRGYGKRAHYVDRDHRPFRERHIKKRLYRQQARIDNGLENGRLTHKEKRKLLKQQRRIKRLARDFREDGYMSRKEKRILTAKLDRASDRIWRFKHNDANRHYRYDSHGRYGRHSRYERNHHWAWDWM